jgi:hypothetical protein
VQVDEARRYDLAPGIDRASARQLCVGGHDADPPILDPDRAGPARRTGAVDDGAAGDDEINGHSVLRAGRATTQNNRIWSG